jgi:protein-disulfide isomerase
MGLLKPLFDVYKDHYAGNPSAEIELVEYGDFQCTRCAAVHTEIKMLREILGSKLNFIFRHFPQSNIHPLALETSIAAESAALQKRFWEMHDILFQNQPNLTRLSLMDYADLIGLDRQYFADGREKSSVFLKVINDFESGVRAGIGSTPAFFINGLRYSGTQDYFGLYRTCKYLLSLKRSQLMN